MNRTKRDWEIIEGIRKLIMQTPKLRKHKEGSDVIEVKGEGIIAQDIYDYVRRECGKR